MSLSILFHFLCAQHVSDINISIIRSVRLFCWITTLVVLFLVRCVLEIRCGWVGVVSVLQAEAQQCVGDSVWLGWSGIRVAGWSATVCWRFGVGGLKKWYPCCRLKHNKSCASACNTDTTLTQPHRISNTHWTKNNTTNVIIQQNSRKLLMMDILMSETCWAHKTWNNIASAIKLVFYPSTILICYFIKML